MHQPMDIDNRRIFSVVWLGQSRSHTLCIFCNMASRLTWEWFVDLRRTVAPNDSERLMITCRALSPKEKDRLLDDYPLARTMISLAEHWRRIT